MLEADLNAITTFNPAVIYPTTTLAELLQQGAEAEFHHWPVVDDDLRLVGIVSEQDIARELAAVSDQHPGGRSHKTALHYRTADQLMTAPAVTVSRWDSQFSGLYYLLKNQIHALPVIENERLIGMVTTTDYLREFSYGGFAISRQPVSDWVQDGEDPVDCECSLEEAAEAMARSDSRHLGVVRGTLPLGVVDARDIRLAQCRLLTRRLLEDENVSLGPVTLRELAAESPVLRPGARLSEAADLMVQHRRQAIAVVTQAGRFVGVLSEEILLHAMAGHKAVPVS